MPIYAGSRKVSFNQSVLTDVFSAPSKIVTSAEWGNISGDITKQLDLMDAISSSVSMSAEWGKISGQLSDQQDLIRYVSSEVDKAIDLNELCVELSSFKKKQTLFENRLSNLDISTDWCVNRINTVETEIPLSVSLLLNDAGYLTSVVLDPEQISTLVNLDGYSKVDHSHDLADLADTTKILDSILSVDLSGATETFKYITLEDTEQPGVKYRLSIKNGNLDIQPL